MWPAAASRRSAPAPRDRGTQRTSRGPQRGLDSFEAKPTYLDVPPSWDGTDAEAALEGYIRTAQAWLKTTRVPAQQRGIQLLAQASGELRSLLSTLDLDEITNDDGGDRVIKFVQKQFQWVLVRSLPRLFEEAVYSQGGQRSRGETFVTYTARKMLLFQKLEKEGCPLPSLARGIMMLNHAHLSRHDSDA
eukprot:2982975-Amphidinium_carterae.1